MILSGTSCSSLSCAWSMSTPIASHKNANEIRSSVCGIVSQCHALLPRVTLSSSSRQNKSPSMYSRAS